MPDLVLRINSNNDRTLSVYSTDTTLYSGSPQTHNFTFLGVILIVETNDDKALFIPSEYGKRNLSLKEIVALLPEVINQLKKMTAKQP